MATRFGTFEDVCDGLPEEQQAIMHELRSIAFGVYPDAVEVVRLGDNASSIGVGPKKMSEAFCYIMPIKKGYVNLGFYYGALLDDPEGLLEGTGKKLRHIKVYDVAQAKKESVREMLVRALEERQVALA